MGPGRHVKFSSYLRFCERCGELYRTIKKKSKVCTACYKPNNNNGLVKVKVKKKVR